MGHSRYTHTHTPCHNALLPMPPGQERYQSITNRFYAETKAVVIVYDIVNVSTFLSPLHSKWLLSPSLPPTQEESWSDVDFWVRELNYYLPAELDNGIPVLFVGNKRDLVDKRDEEQKVVNFRQVYFLPPPAGPLPLSLPCPFPPTATVFVCVCLCVCVCVCLSQVQEVANAYGFLPPVEVSAKTGHGVDKAFMRIVKHLLKHNSPKDSKPPGGPKIPQPPGSGCCSIA